MKKIYLTIVFASLIFFGCHKGDPVYYMDYDPPAIPKNVVVMNGDNRVDIFWDDNRDSDLAGYNVYYSYSYHGEYTRIGSTKNNFFVDLDAVNGDKYYYAVTAYDYNNNESELSYDVVYATPRPEGFNQSIFDYLKFPNTSGYSFSSYSVVPFDDLNCDFFFENYNDTYYLDVYDDTDIQDMGATTDIYDIEEAPENGWSATKDVIAKVGHTYVVWTWNNHFAKIRIRSITPERIVFDWAYQLVKGERQLKNGRLLETRTGLSRDFSR
ncbi:MAG TPA: hypothetical protein PK397_07225 [Ignavibacteriaceae bacterium]|nr:hypothetical protein [Ignavibacteriaceae bacterium]